MRYLCQEWELNKVTYQKLAEIGVLGELQEELSPVKVFLPRLSPEGLPVQVKPGVTAQGLRLTLHIKEARVKNKELEVEAGQFGVVGALVLERGATAAASPSTPRSLSSGPHDSLGNGRHITLVPPI